MAEPIVGTWMGAQTVVTLWCEEDEYATGGRLLHVQLPETWPRVHLRFDQDAARRWRDLLEVFVAGEDIAVPWGLVRDFPQSGGERDG